MIIEWMAGKARLFLPEQDEEFNVGFDFALSPEIMRLLYAQNDDCMATELKGAVQTIAEPAQQETEDRDAFIAQFELDEHELALAVG
jgi:hypothetical protein